MATSSRYSYGVVVIVTHILIGSNQPQHELGFGFVSPECMTWLKKNVKSENDSDFHYISACGAER